MKFYRKFIRTFFLSLIIMLMTVTSFARSLLQEGEKPLRLENIEWSIEEDVVIVSYDLTGPREETYEVKIVLLNENDVTFRFVPGRVSGAVGEGPFAGSRRTIRWEYKKDIPSGLSGGGYYFEISVDRVRGMSPWIYVAAGAAVAGGAAVLLLGKSRESPPGDVVRSLPGPPLRP